MASFNWVRDEDLEEGNPHKVGAKGWEHWVVKCASGRERWMSINMDGLCDALRGFVLRAADVAAPVGSGEAVFGDAEFGGWWSSFKKGVGTIAKLAYENRDKLAKLLPEGQEAATRLIAKYRGGDKEAAKQIMNIAAEAKKGDKNSAALLDALRAEEMQQDTAQLPAIVGTTERGNIVQSVVSGAKCVMSNAEFGAAAKRVKARPASAAQKRALAARMAAARMAAKRMAAKRKQLSSNASANMPGVRTMPATSVWRLAPGAVTAINRGVLRPGVNTPSPLGYPTVPPYYQQPGYPQGMMPGGGYDDGVDAADDDGGGDNMPTDSDAEANVDEATADYEGETQEDEDDVADDGIAADEDLSNAAGGSSEPGDDLDNVGSADVAGEPDLDPMEAADDIDGRGAVDTSTLDAPLDNVGDPELQGEDEENRDPLSDDLMQNTADEARDPMDRPFSNEGDPEMMGEYGAQLKFKNKEEMQGWLKIQQMKKREEMLAAGASKAKIAKTMRDLQANARRNLQAVQQGSRQTIAAMRRNEKENASRRAMKDEYEDKLAVLENKLYDRDMADDKRQALEAQAASFRAKLEDLKALPTIQAAEAAEDAAYRAERARLEAEQDAGDAQGDGFDDGIDSDADRADGS